MSVVIILSFNLFFVGNRWILMFVMIRMSLVSRVEGSKVCVGL